MQQVTCIRNFKKTSKDRMTIKYIETKIETLDSCWKNIFKFHTAFLIEDNERSDAEQQYVESNRYDDYEEEYYDGKFLMEEKLKEINNEATPNIKSNIEIAVGNGNQLINADNDALRDLRANNNEQVNALVNNNADQLRLPRIPLPTFDGEYGAWTSFRDQFKSIIDSQVRLPSVQKIFYLKSSLHGEAAQLLKHFQVTDANYRPAWEYLSARYENKRILINTEFNKLFSQPVMTIETASGIKGLLDTTNDALQELNNLGIVTETWDSLLVYMTVQKLSLDSHQA